MDFLFFNCHTMVAYKLLLHRWCESKISLKLICNPDLNQRLKIC